MSLISDIITGISIAIFLKNRRKKRKSKELELINTHPELKRFDEFDQQKINDDGSVDWSFLEEKIEEA